ncbi:MAG: hypothetical protein AcusKO_42180 [Acuticoccus sp.]
MRPIWLLATAVPVVALALAMSGNLPKKLIYNASASAPIGLYWLDNRPLKRCDLVLVHVPKRMRDLVQQRGYLPPNTPLLKRVVGIEGDRICRRRATILVNGSVVAEALEETNWGVICPGGRAVAPSRKRRFSCFSLIPNPSTAGILDP